MKKGTLKTIIKEAMQSRISEIDKAGNDAAATAKLGKIAEDISKVNKLVTMLGKEVFSKYIDAKLLSAVVKDLQKSAKELDKAKEKLEKGQAKKVASGASKPKPTLSE